jgi:hypothetical protein
MMEMPFLGTMGWSSQSLIFLCKSMDKCKYLLIEHQIGYDKQVLLMISLPHLFNAQIVNKSQQIQAEQMVLSHLFNNAQTQRKDMQAKETIMHKSKERIYGLKRKLLQSTVT